jgi:hypothetical protein
MALWGKADGIYSPGTVTVDYANKTITGSGTSFTAAAVVDVISVGAGFTFGEAVISGITSDTFIAIATTESLSGAAIAGVAYSISQKPKYTLLDSHYAAGEVYGVDEYEAASVVTTKYAVTHAGWVGIKTYVDSSGSLRVKTETLVAMSGISSDALPAYGVIGDAADDTLYPDRYITISAQPVSLTGVSTTSDQTFSVTAYATPTASLSYQWQYSSTGVAYTDLTDSGIYSNVTTDTVGIGSTTVDADRPDGYYYRAVITADGGATQTSDVAILVYA